MWHFTLCNALCAFTFPRLTPSCCTFHTSPCFDRCPSFSLSHSSASPPPLLPVWSPRDEAGPTGMFQMNIKVKFYQVKLDSFVCASAWMSLYLRHIIQEMTIKTTQSERFAKVHLLLTIHKQKGLNGKWAGLSQTWRFKDIDSLWHHAEPTVDSIQSSLSHTLISLFKTFPCFILTTMTGAACMTKMHEHSSHTEHHSLFRQRSY